MALNKLISPKLRFIAGEPERVALEKLTNTDWYYNAVQAALSSFVRDTTMSEEGNMSAGEKFHAIRGARTFAEILLTMADRPKVVSHEKVGNLNHNLS